MMMLQLTDRRTDRQTDRRASRCCRNTAGRPLPLSEVPKDAADKAAPLSSSVLRGCLAQKADPSLCLGINPIPFPTPKQYGTH